MDSPFPLTISPPGWLRARFPDGRALDCEAADWRLRIDGALERIADPPAQRLAVRDLLAAATGLPPDALTLGQAEQFAEHIALYASAGAAASAANLDRIAGEIAAAEQLPTTVALRIAPHDVEAVVEVWPLHCRLDVLQDESPDPRAQREAIRAELARVVGLPEEEIGLGQAEEAAAVVRLYAATLFESRRRATLRTCILARMYGALPSDFAAWDQLTQDVWIANAGAAGAYVQRIESAYDQRRPPAVYAATLEMTGDPRLASRAQAAAALAERRADLDRLHGDRLRAGGA